MGRPGLIARVLGHVLGLVVGLASMSAAPAAEWPNRPVRIIAPSSPGGAADTFARLLAEHLTAIFQQRFYVENRAGAGGLIGVQAAAHAEPDGYTLVTSSVGYDVIAPAMSPNPGFDALKDLVHIAFLGGPPNVLVVNPALGVTSLAEFLALARRGAPLDYVSPGVGSHGQLVAEYFAQQAGIRLQHVPYKGSSPAMLDLIAGSVKVGTMTWTSAVGNIRARNIVPLAVSSSRRVAEYPGLPTFAELGYPSLVTTTWYTLSAPTGLPDETVRRLNAAVLQMLTMPDVQALYAKDAIEVVPMTPAEVTAYMASETEKWAPVAKKLVQ